MTDWNGGGGHEGARPAHLGAARLQRLELFADLGDRMLQLLELSCWWVYRHGEEVRQSPKGADAAYVVVEGSVDLLHMGPGGHTLKTGQLQCGEVLDLRTPFAAEGDLVVAKVRSRTATICIVPWPVFLRTVAANPPAAATYIEQERRRRQRAEASARENAFDRISTRVKHWLRRLSQKNRGGVAICTLLDLGHLAGTREEEASRVIAELERQGLVVRRGQGRIEVPDPDALI